MKKPTLAQFLDNPACVDHTSFGNAWKEKQRYETRWYYMQRVFKHFELYYFKESEDSYYILAIIPSERRGNTYDVLIHFYTDNDNRLGDSTLRNYSIQFFSNNPVFAYRFAHADYVKGLMIPFCADKLPAECLTKVAEKSNPKDSAGFDHSFYHAGMYLLKQQRFLNKTYINSRTIKFDVNFIAGLVRSVDQTVEEYKKLKDRTDIKERFNKEKSTADAIKDTLSDAKATLSSSTEKAADKLGKLKNKILPKKTNVPNIKRIAKTTAKASNATRRGTRAVHVIRARKSNRK